MKRLGGVIPALITPYDDSGRVLDASIDAIIEKTLSEGVSGFYVGGSTAETFLLTLDERKHILEVAMKRVKGRVPVICHVGSISTDVACDLARHAESLGVDAVSAIPPFYYRFSIDEIEQYYLDIADAVELPLILYNFPAFSGVTIDQSTVPRLFADERIVGIKHTSLDLYQLERMKHGNPEFTVLNGHDEVTLGALSLGADGSVGSTFNCLATIFVEIQAHVANGELSAARECQNEANGIIGVLKRVGVFTGIKYILGLQGIECGECRRPFQPMSESARTEVRDAVSKSPHLRERVLTKRL